MLNLKTELCLGLPGGGGGTEGDVMKISGKRGFSETVDLKLNLQSNDSNTVDLKDKTNNSPMAMEKAKDQVIKPPAKAQVVGWPPVRSYRKNIMAQKSTAEEKNEKVAAAAAAGSSAAAFVKVSMDGAPYLRKVDLKLYKSYQQWRFQEF